MVESIIIEVRNASSNPDVQSFYDFSRIFLGFGQESAGRNVQNGDEDAQGRQFPGHPRTAWTSTTCGGLVLYSMFDLAWVNKMVNKIYIPFDKFMD